MDERLRSLLLLGGREALNGEEMVLQGGSEFFAIKDELCKIIRGFGGF